MVIIKGTRKLSRKNNRATSRCPNVELAVGTTATRVHLDFSEGGLFAMTWLGFAELVNAVVPEACLQEAGITPWEFRKLILSLSGSSPELGEEETYDE
jgi:hypothetical protein